MTNKVQMFTFDIEELIEQEIGIINESDSNDFPKCFVFFHNNSEQSEKFIEYFESKNIGLRTTDELDKLITGGLLGTNTRNITYIIDSREINGLKRDEFFYKRLDRVFYNLRKKYFDGEGYCTVQPIYKNETDNKIIKLYKDGKSCQAK